MFTNGSSGVIQGENLTTSYSDFLYYFYVSQKLRYYLFVVVFPIMAVFGLTGNVISCLMLLKLGLNKPSNILLAALCFADSLYLFSALNIPNLLQYFPVKAPNYFYSWEYPEDIAYVLYILTLFFQAFSFYGLPLSAFICTFITMERFVAVFYPLHFTSIVTSRRVWAALGFIHVIWVPYVAFVLTSYGFTYQYFSEWGLRAGFISFTAGKEKIDIYNYLFMPFVRHIPIILIAGGSVLIAFRVKLTMKNRQRMVSADKGVKTTKTTRMLLVVCLLFCVTKLPSLLEYFYNVESYHVQTFMSAAEICLDYINSCSNFLVYIIMNKKFRKMFNSMFF